MSGERKIFWVKSSGLFLSTMALITLYFGSCDLKLNRCFWGNDILVSRTLFHIFLSMAIILPLSFVVSTKTFKKWLIFVASWLVIDIVWIINSPVMSHHDFDIGPTTKESVSTWMGFFLIFSSLAMFIVSKMENTSLWKKWVYGIFIFIVEVFLIFALT